MCKKKNTIDGYEFTLSGPNELRVNDDNGKMVTIMALPPVEQGCDLISFDFTVPFKYLHKFTGLVVMTTKHTRFLYYDGELIDEISRDTEAVYCPICTSCGEDGCCSAAACQQHPDGKYCESNLAQMKFSYYMFKDTFELMKDDEESKKKFDKIYDENWDIFLKND